jgi:hypothetical protein
VAVRLAYVRGAFTLPDLARVRQAWCRRASSPGEGPALRALLAR